VIESLKSIFLKEVQNGNGSSLPRNQADLWWRAESDLGRSTQKWVVESSECSRVVRISMASASSFSCTISKCKLEIRPNSDLVRNDQNGKRGEERQRSAPQPEAHVQKRNGLCNENRNGNETRKHQIQLNGSDRVNQKPF
jgi:hypothetical protein